MSSLDELNLFLESHPDLEILELLVTDMNGIIRGKRLDVSEAKTLFSKGINFPAATHLLDSSGNVIDGLVLGTDDGDPDVTAKPVANCNVKVINARKRERIFPLVEESFRVQAVVTNIAPSRLVGSGEVRKLSEELAINLGDAVAKLFYSHYTGRLGEDVEKRRH